MIEQHSAVNAMAPEVSAGKAVATPTSLVFAHLHTYFLFPFALDKEAIQADHPEAWPGKTKWIDGLDSWIAGESGRREAHGIAALGFWRRSSYSSYELDSPAYSDLLFFHPVVRYVFFDTSLGRHADNRQNLLRCYSLDLDPETRLWFEGTDKLGRGARAEVRDLKLYLSAQEGIGLLSIGVTAEEIDAAKAIWINRRLRKLYPLDASSIPQGRTPDWLALRLERGSELETLCEERFDHPAMVGFYAPLPNTIKSLLYFVDYELGEYEPILDENLIVYSYGELKAGIAGETAAGSAQGLLREFLYLGHKHRSAGDQRYGPASVRFGFTAHSCTVLASESEPAEVRDLEEQPGASAPTVLAHDDLEICRTFHTRYYLMTVVALFYRAVLLDLNERSALVSRRLLQDQQSGTLTLSTINLVNELRAEFLNFSSYWHFDDLTCKQTDNDLFRRLCAEYNIDRMKEALEKELGHMGDFVYNFYQLRNTEAVNRLAMLSLIFGGGAVLTGFFGMNFGREFGKALFEGEGVTPLLHYFMVTLVTCVVFGSLALGIFLVFWNWRDYLAILLSPGRGGRGASLKRHR